MSTRRGVYQHRGLTGEQLSAIRPSEGLRGYQCSFCSHRLSSVRDVVPHEAACGMRQAVELVRAQAWRRFVRAWSGR